MISYSARAAKALGFLKRPYNDIEIFVEDTSSLSMWTRIISKLLPNKIKLRSVNMLAGRENILKACNLDQSNDGRKRLYIIDGDFDFLHGKAKPRLKFLYRIRAYCIENILTNKSGTEEVAFDCHGGNTKSSTQAILNYDGIIKTHEKSLRELFVVYATAALIDKSVKTVSYSVKNLIENSQTQIDFSSRKIFLRCADIIRQLCKKTNIKKVRETRLKIRERAMKLPSEMVISGKDYILPVVHLNLARKFGYKGTIEHLKSYLAREFESGLEMYLARAVKKAAA